MVTITDKPEHDPVADMLIVDAYMHWALEATQKIIGEDKLHVILREAGLERFIDHPPSGELDVTDVTFGDYANFNAALLNHFQEDGMEMVKNIGRASIHMAIAFERNLFNAATIASAKKLPVAEQLKMGLAAQLAGFKIMSEKEAHQEYKARIEDRGDTYAYIIETCPMCAGKRADSCIGWLWEAAIEESARQAWGEFFDVVETECRAKGDPAGVWMVSKEPSDESWEETAL